MDRAFYAALEYAVGQKGMSIAELADTTHGIGHLASRAQQNSPSITLNDLYSASRALGVVPLVAVKRANGEDIEIIHIDDNGTALRKLRGTQSVAERIGGKNIPDSTYYWMENGSRPHFLKSVVRVWSEFGYNVRFLEPRAPDVQAQVKEEDTQVSEQEVSGLPDDLMKLNKDQVSALLRRYFD